MKETLVILTILFCFTGCSFFGFVADEKLGTKTTGGRDSGVFETVGKEINKKRKKDKVRDNIEKISKQEIHCEDLGAHQVCTAKEGCWCEKL